jgi:dienelactone hydrolase
MSQIILFHSAQGLRDDVLGWAGRLRTEGHEVWTPDLFEGATFEHVEDGIACRDEIGIPELMKRAAGFLDRLPARLVYAGFSMGAASAAYFAARRPGAHTAVLMHGVAPWTRFGASAWPEGVPVQIHYAAGDTLAGLGDLPGFEEMVRASGSTIKIHTYPGNGHLFADPAGPGYDPASATLMWERVRAFLRHP